MPWLSHSLTTVSIPKITFKKGQLSRRGNLKQQTFQCQGKGDEVQETKKKRKEDLGTQVGEKPVGRACSMHEGSMLMKSRSKQAFGQGACDTEGIPTFV